MRLIFLAFLAITSCSYPPLKGRIHTSLSDECQGHVQAANEFWGHLFGEEQLMEMRVSSDLSPPGDREVVFIAYHSPDYEGAHDSQRWPDGHVENVLIRLRNDGCGLAEAAHELGHMLTLDHQDDPTALMHDRSSSKMELTASEISRASAAWEAL